MTDQTSLRTRLRTDLTGVHENLDAQMSEFDLQTPTGFASFLRIQHGALTALDRAQAGDLTRVAISDLKDRAHADLVTLGAPPLSIPADLTCVLHPVAVDYVIAGSRLGSQLLRRRWSGASDPLVRKADAYFSAPAHIDLWKDFAARAADLPAQGTEADRILRHAAAVFALFSHHAATETRERVLPHV